METAVAKRDSGVIEYDTEKGKVKLSPATVARYMVSDQPNGEKPPVTEEEIKIFMALCQYQGLNPWLKEVYLVKYGKSPAQNIVAKSVHVKRAARHPQFDGIKSGVIVQHPETLEITFREGTFYLPTQDLLVGGWAEGYRKDQSIAKRVTVSFNEYEGKKADGYPNKTWAKMPGTMIEKVAISQCLRDLFPEELAGLYQEGEMANSILADEAANETTFKGKAKIVPVAEVDMSPPSAPMPTEAEVSAEIDAELAAGGADPGLF